MKDYFTHLLNNMLIVRVIFGMILFTLTVPSFAQKGVYHGREYYQERAKLNKARKERKKMLEQAAKDSLKYVKGTKEYYIDSIRKQDSTIFFKDVPKLDIEDKIFIVNKSPYFLLQGMVAKMSDKGELETVGAFTNIAPGQTYLLFSYEDEKLKKLRKRTIAIKIKGSRKPVQQDNSETDNSITVPECFTYDFDAKLSESRHDLYIEIISNDSGGSITDF